MNTQDPRVAKTMKRIEDALLSSLAARPFRDVTISMLCSQAGINKTTFYKHFSDKYDCLNRFLDRRLEQFREQLNVDFVLAPAEKIDAPEYQRIFLEVAQFMYQRRRENLILWHAEIERQFYNEMCDAIYEAIFRAAARDTPGGGRERANLVLYARLFSVHTMALLHWWFDHEDIVTAQDVVRLMTGNMSYGLYKTFKEIPKP